MAATSSAASPTVSQIPSGEHEQSRQGIGIPGLPRLKGMGVCGADRLVLRVIWRQAFGMRLSQWSVGKHVLLASVGHARDDATVSKVARSRDRVRTLMGWLQASHLAPTITMTIVITGICAAAGWPTSRLLLCAAAALSGQLSVGWSNDAHDAAVDRRVGRTTKPVVNDLVSETSLRTASVVTLVTSVALSLLAAGVLAGSFHVLAVVSAWVYNFRLSRTAWSWVPYAVSFACLAPFATLGSTEPRWPDPRLAIALALIGVGAHLANALPDLDRDQEAEVGGLAVTLGPTRTVWLAVTSFLGASVILAFLVGGWAALGIIVVAVASGIASLIARDAGLVFKLVMIAGIADLVLLIVGGVMQT